MVKLEEDIAMKKLEFLEVSELLNLKLYKYWISFVQAKTSVRTLMRAWVGVWGEQYLKYVLRRRGNNYYDPRYNYNFDNDHDYDNISYLNDPHDYYF